MCTRVGKYVVFLRRENNNTMIDCSSQNLTPHLYNYALSISSGWDETKTLYIKSTYHAAIVLRNSVHSLHGLNSIGSMMVTDINYVHVHVNTQSQIQSC